MTLSMDLLPTFAEITGTVPRDTKILSGKSILSQLADPSSAKTNHKYFFFGNSAVRHKDWKYHKQEKFKVKSTARKSKGPSLYNLKDDIGESLNLINDYPEITEQLKNALEQHIKTVGKK